MEFTKVTSTAIYSMALEICCPACEHGTYLDLDPTSAINRTTCGHCGTEIEYVRDPASELRMAANLVEYNHGKIGDDFSDVLGQSASDVVENLRGTADYYAEHNGTTVE